MFQVNDETLELYFESKMPESCLLTSVTIAVNYR